MQARVKSDERLAALQEKRIGLAMPPQPVRLTKFTKTPKAKTPIGDSDLPPSKKLKHASAVSLDGHFTVPVVGVNDFEACLKSSGESLKARLSGGKLVNSDKTLVATFTAPKNQLHVFITPTACKKHRKSTQVLKEFTPQPQGASSSSTDTDMKPIMVAQNSEEQWEWFHKHPSSCRWIYAGPKDKDFQAVLNKLALADHPNVMTMSQFCSSLGQRVA